MMRLIGSGSLDAWPYRFDHAWRTCDCQQLDRAKTVRSEAYSEQFL
jgi:hypothetical protein